MAELFKIVRGNSFPLKIYMSSILYDSDGRLSSQTMNLNTVGNLQVSAFSYNKEVILPYTVSSDGAYLTATISNSKKLKYGSWGIKVTGTYNNLTIAATEHRVFKIVACNALSYIPYGIVEGEHSYMYNLKFASGVAEDGGGDDPQPTGQGGWIGFQKFTNPSEISTSDLTWYDNIFGRKTVTNTEDYAHLVVVTPSQRTLSFTIDNFPAPLEMWEDTTNNHKCYYTSQRLTASTMNIQISV